MGKVDKTKKKQKKKGNMKKSPSKNSGGDGDGGDYSVGTLSNLVAQSCGVEEPEFDPKLASMFSSSKEKAVIKLVQKSEEALPTPPPVVEKVKNKKVLKNKDAAGIRVAAKTKINAGLTPGKKVRRNVNADESKNEGEAETEEGQEDDEGQKGASKTAETKKTLRELNRPKEKNPDLEARTLFVGNVPKEATKKQLLKLFKGFGGKIETIRLRCAAPDKPTRLKKVAINRKELHPDRASIAAYIRYSSREEAQNAMEKAVADGVTLGDHHLVLDLADRSIKKDNKRAIFIGNLHLKTNDDEIWELFSECGQIESVRIVRDRDSGLGKGFGYVNFVDRASVELALNKDGTEFRNRPLRISRCVKKLKKVEGTVGGTVKSKTGINSPSDKRRGNKKVSQGKRQRKEGEQFSGDKTAEVGKFKRHSKKPNKEELKKARLAKQLSAPTLSKTDYKAKKKELRKLTKPRWRNSKPVS